MEDERPRFQTDALGVIVSIAIREHVGNLIIILVPGALEAGLGDLRLWLPLLGDNDLADTLVGPSAPDADGLRGLTERL
jgi:hypothetical protein